MGIVRKTVGSTWRWAVNRPGHDTPTEGDFSRFEQDDLRHLLATAGAMSWGITDARLVSRRKSGPISA